MDQMGGVAEVLEHAQVLVSQLETTAVKENLKGSLELLRRNAFLLGEIKRLENATGEESLERAKAVLEVNANLHELCRIYSVFSET